MAAILEGNEPNGWHSCGNAFVGKADYVEIELDVADQIRPFPPAKRVITYTDLQETPRYWRNLRGVSEQKP